MARRSGVLGCRFERRLGALSRWLAGPEFSVADLNVASALYRALRVDLAKWPRVQAWLNACWERPAAKRARAMRE
ncbi:MAG: glutathione S-transferase C-terminal domain-containing protein [Betaproteobacteria bacterium]|nr:glutathione S-transferase C-terminal domain-containing protein [Betaproteobacteria bacterium]